MTGPVHQFFGSPYVSTECDKQHPLAAVFTDRMLIKETVPDICQKDIGYKRCGTENGK